MQQVAPDVWVDGAHNPGGIRAFVQAVKKQNPSHIQLLFAAVSDKDYHEMIRLLCTQLVLESVTVVQLESERGLQAAALAKQFEEAGCSRVTAFDSTKDAAGACAFREERGRPPVHGGIPVFDRRDSGGFKAAAACRPGFSELKISYDTVMAADFADAVVTA